MTKEELLKVNVELENTVKAYKSRDEETRRDLSKILGYYTMKDRVVYYSKVKEITILSWLQISAEIGKLLNAKNELDLITNTEELQINNQNCNRIIKELQEKLENNK